MGDYAKARAAYERALKISQHVLGPDHPTTQKTRADLADLLKAMQKETG